MEKKENIHKYLRPVAEDVTSFLKFTDWKGSFNENKGLWKFEIVSGKGEGYIATMKASTPNELINKLDELGKNLPDNDTSNTIIKLKIILLSLALLNYVFLKHDPQWRKRGFKKITMPENNHRKKSKRDIQ